MGLDTTQPSEHYNCGQQVLIRFHLSCDRNGQLHCGGRRFRTRHSCLLTTTP